MSVQQGSGWARPGYRAGGGDACLLYVVFGDIGQPLTFPRAAYRTKGVPAGVTLRAYSRANHADFMAGIYAGWLSRHLEATRPGLLRDVENAPMCLILQGLVTDPPTLDYLRDAVGVLMRLLDTGGVALLDWLTLTWYDAAQWRERIFAPDAPVPLHHTAILLSPEEGTNDERMWVHTRGMRKFGRPDISIHDVSPAYQDAYIELCNRFMAMQAFGETVPEGQPIRMRGLPPGLTCRHGGSLDDPDFNNVHIEICLPDRR